MQNSTDTSWDRNSDLPICVAQRLNHCATAVPSDMCKVKGKVQAWTGCEGSRKLRFPDFVTTAQDGGKAVSLTHRPPLPPGNTPGTHFCWRLIRPQGHSAIGRIMSMQNSTDTSWDRNSDLPICVAQRLNHCATAVSSDICKVKGNVQAWTGCEGS